ncbi:MAG: hypothetical protein K2L22_04455 [Muribaculaceae bacterium]|nr:hypothetical protein [Muribaculaceae bacterium]
MDKDLKFIARHYRKGIFAMEPALRRVKGRKAAWWSRSRIAAACAAAAIFTASAAIIVYHNHFTEAESPVTVTGQPARPAAEIVRVIDFEQAPLTEVVAKIREVYGVEVTNLPTDADQYELSLHYEGSALDLVETINDILDTDMKVSE